ncbi:MAG: hypothetical protein ACRDRJ_27520 [Streptosporangiaceae bacterium]
MPCSPSVQPRPRPACSITATRRASASGPAARTQVRPIPELAEPVTLTVNRS